MDDKERLLRKKGRRFVLNLGLAVVAVIFALAAGEVVLRIGAGDKFGMRPNFYVADDAIGWKPAADLNHTFYGADFKIDVHTDAEGHRLGALGEVGYDEELILICGDSNVFGWGVSSHATCASYLDEMIHDKSSGARRVVNLGVAGYGTMQYYMALERFLAVHPNARIASVLVVHAPNDPVDNIQSVGYHIGEWVVFDKEPKQRSALHIANLISYSIKNLRQRIGNTSDHNEQNRGSLHPYLQDVLHAYSYKLPKKLSPDINFRGWAIDVRGITENDYSIDKLIEFGRMTKLQKDLAFAAINSFHRILENRNTKIIHMMIPTSPDWHVNEMRNLLTRSIDSAGNEVINLYRCPDGIDDFDGKVRNAHKGGHYTPAFNKYWADNIYTALVENNVLSR
jgi:hypothetical protein